MPCSEGRPRSWPCAPDTYVSTAIKNNEMIVVVCLAIIFFKTRYFIKPDYDDTGCIPVVHNGTYSRYHSTAQAIKTLCFDQA